MIHNSKYSLLSMYWYYYVLKLLKNSMTEAIQWCWYLHDSLQAFYSISVISGARITVHEVRAPQRPARNSLVTHAWQLAKCTHFDQLQARHSISIVCGARITVREVRAPQLSAPNSLVKWAWQLAKGAHPNLERVWQLAKYAHSNSRHTIPFLSFVVRALQCVKCAHLNLRHAISFLCAQPNSHARACAQPDSQLTQVACMKENVTYFIAYTNDYRIMT